MTLSLLLKLSLGVSLSAFLLRTPVILGLWILTLAILISTIVALTLNAWLAMVFFLIYIGGLLVLFSYFSALTPNQKLSAIPAIIILLLTPITLSFTPDKLFWSTTILDISTAHPSLSIASLYAVITGPLVIVLGIILFIILVAAVKISARKAGPLRPFT